MVSKNITRLGAFPQLAMKAPVATIANLNITLSGHQTIDTVPTADNMRVLVAGQIDATQNGIWIADSKGWVRAPDWNIDDDVTRGAMIINTHRKTGWIIEFTDASFVLDTTSVSFIAMFGTVGIAADSENDFDPGYDVTFVSTTSFTVDGVDVVNLYYVGRRIKLKDQFGVFTFGIVATSVFVTDTTVTLTMEGADTVPNPLSRAILTTSDVSWVPVVPNHHPFTTKAKAKIVSGRIGAEDWWVIVASGGFIATSNDAGLNWNQRTPTGGLVAQDINDVAYDFDNQRFMAVADGTWIITSIDGINWISSQPSDLTTPITTGTGNLHHIAYGNTESGGSPGFALYGSFLSATNSHMFKTTDYGATWEDRTGISSATNSITTFRWNAQISTNKYFTTVGITFSITPDPGGWTATNEDSLGAGANDIAFRIVNNTATTVHTLGAIRTGVGGGTGGWSFSEPANTGVFGTSDLLCVAYSTLLDRLIAAGKDGKLGFSDDGTTWALVSNGFNPTAHILDVAYDENDAIFIAISNDGVICRSTNGT